jgi:hypothetical protein
MNFKTNLTLRFQYLEHLKVEENPHTNPHRKKNLLSRSRSDLIKQICSPEKFDYSFRSTFILCQNRAQSLVSQQPHSVSIVSGAFYKYIFYCQHSSTTFAQRLHSLWRWVHQIAVCESCVPYPYSGYEYILCPTFSQVCSVLTQ